jgi:hypothetical protein
MTDFLPFIIAACIVSGFVLLRGGYVAHSNINDPEENYQIGSKYMDNSVFTGFFGKSGGGKKTRHRKHKRGKISIKKRN